MTIRFMAERARRSLKVVWPMLVLRIWMSGMAGTGGLPAFEVFWWLTVGSGGGGREVVELDGWRGVLRLCGVVVGRADG